MFTGFPAAALTFFAGLEADNSKQYWTEHKQVYDECVKQPFLDLLDALDDEFKPLRMFRPNRDVRFSKDKSPYKTHTGAAGEREGGAMYYVALSSEGLFAATGYYQCAPDQLERLRHAIDTENVGGELVKIVAAQRRKGMAVEGDSLKTAPRGYAKDHPRIDLLRMKWITTGKKFPVEPWLHTKGALARVQKVWRDAEPLNAWLDTHVGPSTRPPDDEREVW
ncbi:MAG: DUF2461 domain-containing protein [Acidimicrobiia bacterium]